MPSDNQRLKVLLQDARIICTNKFRSIQAVHGVENTELAQLKLQLETVIQRFDDPALWANPVPFDESTISIQMLKIDICDTSHIRQFADLASTLVSTFEAFFTPPTLLNPLAMSAPISVARTSDMNIRVLNELNICQRNVGERKKFFRREQNLELDSDPRFVPKQKEQRKVQSTYRQALTDNQVLATDSDLAVFERISTTIGQSIDLENFFAIYEMHTETMRSKVPVV
jgi:hypothetical protein